MNEQKRKSTPTGVIPLHATPVRMGGRIPDESPPSAYVVTCGGFPPYNVRMRFMHLYNKNAILQ